MDPDANLKEQLELALSIRRQFDTCENDHGDFPYSEMKSIAAEGDRLAELVLALIEWRRKGGYDPLLKKD